MENDNIFKKIELPLLQVPTDVKEKVLSDIESAKVILELATLFSSECTSIINNVFIKPNK
tara:strand:+ start:537 stop:716 length:180 start_codon:yes stop_codon:yes gene_type:complete